ncbi:MAG: HAMP domain-containing sensor histidine kinase [Caldicoprobacterales bacterium]
MNRLLKNPEFKAIILKLLILQFVFTMLILALTSYEFIVINKAISEKNIAMVGKVLFSYPELEDDIVSIVTKEATFEEINRGRTILKKYGYTHDVSLFVQPTLKDLFLKSVLRLGMLTLLFIIPLLFLIKREYSQIYSKIIMVTSAAEKVMHNDFSIVLPEDREGDFALLNHQFNQMANRIKASLEHLKDDKIFLKNIMSDISHQLKTPLSSLIVLNELMLNDKNMDEKTRDEFLSRSLSQLERIEWLIINLLKMARLEAGAIEFQVDTLPLIQPVEKALYTLDVKIKEKKQNIIINQLHENIVFKGDKDWTAEALINIIKNCIEHTPIGGDINIYLDESPIFSRVIIKDTGEGILKKDLPHIFKRFYKGSSSVKAESIGIGLALAKTIVESQNGIISVKSQRGKGTEFTVTFLKSVI